MERVRLCAVTPSEVTTAGALQDKNSMKMARAVKVSPLLCLSGCKPLSHFTAHQCYVCFSAQ